TGSIENSFRTEEGNEEVGYRDRPCRAMVCWSGTAAHDGFPTRCLIRPAAEREFKFVGTFERDGTGECGIAVVERRYRIRRWASPTPLDLRRIRRFVIDREVESVRRFNLDAVRADDGPFVLGK